MAGPRRRDRERFCEYTRSVRWAVKCRAIFFAAALAGSAGVGHAQLFPSDYRGAGATEPHAAAALDPRIPQGAVREQAPRPPEAPASTVCSAEYPVCVHGSDKIELFHVLEWIQALESAYERVILCLGTRAPLTDGARGGGPGLDLYLTSGVDPLAVHADPPALGATRDVASAFCVVGDRDAALARSATLCVGEAVGLSLDASETPFARRALATELWLHTGFPTSMDAQAIDDVQAAPEHAVAARDASRFAEGGALLYEYLDAAKGKGDGDLAPLVTYALSAGAPSPAGPRFVNEPDTLDVLRATFGPTPTDVARFFADFTLARAFVGSRDAEGDWPLLRWTGAFGRVRFDWSVPIASLPRHLAPAHPIEPTGATYLWVALDASSAGQSIAFQADWEPPVAFRWVLAVVGADGRVVRRLDVPYLERETHVERIVTDLSGGAGLLIAGTNLGGLGPTYPFDPDFEPYEPHGYAVYLARQ
jgi:hypothetical protein